MAIKAPKGTKDVLPNESYKWRYIENEWAKICSEYGFEEMRTPTFEATELFNRGIGDTTDVVQKEMYTFEDLGHRSITLKPEGTSPAVRAFIESNQYAETQPSKYYYNTPCFRYEKPQAGRLREFHQFGIENFGTSDMLADAEVIALAADFLERMGIDDIELHISSVGCRECRPLHRKALQDFLMPKYDELCDTCKGRFDKNPMRILDCKSPVCKELVQGAPMVLDYLCDDCKKALEDLKSHLDAMEIKYIVDPSIVRGLDYYTKTAFEFITTKIGAQGTVCGGGRYDHLIEEVGGPDMPGVGFGLGKERLLMLMEASGADFGGKETPELFVAWVGDEALSYSLALVYSLRKQGVRVIIDTKARNLKGQLKYANKLGAAYTVVIGEDEISTGELTLKNMNTSEQTKTAREDLIKTIRG
ncbi:MAG: histidine--tRNA ligase [Clostridiales bacterium]|nr:histidine--tRNA ligase [Candidatus Crickella merdequi]